MSVSVHSHATRRLGAVQPIIVPGLGPRVRQGAVAARMPSDCIPVRVRRGQRLFGEGDDLHSLYRVHAGEFKLVRVEEDGFEQVLDFVGPGEWLGLDGLHAGHFRVSAVALEDSLALAVPPELPVGPSGAASNFEARVRASWATQFDRLVDLSWLLSAVGAERRTARFLVLLSRRMARRGLSPTRLMLRMRRRDIASHIGLSHESVSRAFTMLAKLGLIHVQGRQVEIVEPAALDRFARINRGDAESPRGARGTRCGGARHGGAQGVDLHDDTPHGADVRLRTCDGAARSRSRMIDMP